MLGVVLVRVDLRDRSVGGEALCADAETVNVGGELGVPVALCGRAGSGGAAGGRVLSTECASR